MITALTSNQMIAPSYWIDPRNGNRYYLAVQYPEKQVQESRDLQRHPAARARIAAAHAARHDQQHPAASKSPTEVDHYQLRRTIDIYRPAARRRSGRNREADRRD